MHSDSDRKAFLFFSSNSKLRILVLSLALMRTMFGDIPASVAFLSVLTFSVLGLIAFYYVKNLDSRHRFYLNSKHSAIKSYGSYHEEGGSVNKSIYSNTQSLIAQLNGYRLSVQQYMAAQSPKPVLFESNPDKSVSAFNEHPDLLHTAKPIEHTPNFNPVPSEALQSLFNAFYERNQRKKEELRESGRVEEYVESSGEDKLTLIDALQSKATTTYGSVVLDCSNHP